MPCNHIQIVEETTSAINEDVSQVPTTPMAAAIEDEAIIALNSMETQLSADEPPLSQHNGTTHGMSFTNLMEVDKISDYVDILAGPNERLVEPLVFTRSCQGYHAGYEQSPTHLSRLPSTPMQPLNQQQREFLDENVNPISNDSDRALQESNQIIDLLRVPVSEVCVRQVNREAFVDYTNSLILTSTQYIETMKSKNAKKEEVAKAKEEKRIEKEKRRK
ncbi:hypothetical protein L7F22_068675 [Adiantum nelumboides]|nr:hypothetical protein [Adiantum nelumboides]